MNVAGRVRQLLEAVAPAGAGLAGDASLLDAGVLDSLALEELIAELEAGFGIVVVDEDVVPENFDSIDAIAALVTTRLGSER